MNRRRILVLGSLLAVLVIVLAAGPIQGMAASAMGGGKTGGMRVKTEADLVRLDQMRPTKAQRMAAVAKLAAIRANPANQLLNGLKGLFVTPKALNPAATPDYFGTIPNFANSQLPMDSGGNFATTTTAVVPGTGIRKFVDTLPGLGASGANLVGQYIPVAVPDTSTYPGSDYYVIALIRYSKQFSPDLPPTELQGYVQLNSNGTSMAVPPSYLGPAIVATRDRPVRVKFINKLPTNAGGNLFLPVDKTIMGAGMGPNGGEYSQNRATLHLHGGATPWISDGTPHQWTTPAGEVTTYTKGVSVMNVPDMGNEPTGTLTFYYTNQQSARLMFYHDHSYGITRLNVYAGEAAPFILQDPIEQKLVNGGTFTANGGSVNVSAGTIPADQIPLVVQDKTFVPSVSQLTSEDPTWDIAHWGGRGNLWLPHVYMPNQTGSLAQGGVNGIGRWDYNPWFYPPVIGQINGPVPNPLYNGGLNGEPPQNPGTPLPTVVPEAFMDTPIVNGAAYPVLKVQPKAYRFRILNASNDRTWNLQLYYAKSSGQMWGSNAASQTLLNGGAGEVNMVPAAVNPTSPLPPTWPVDGRDGGVPDPNAVGPSMIQIGNEGGFIPSATVLPNTPVGYEYFRRTITVLNVTNHTLLLGPAERADVIVDFSTVPSGTTLIMYNDAPAPMPGFDSRNDYFTGDGDQTPIGGAPNTLPGYGPNTRTVMQIKVAGPAAAPFNLSKLQTGLQAAYAATQDKPIVPEKAYASALATTIANDNYMGGTDTSLTFTPLGQSTPLTFGQNEKAIIEGFDRDYGRMNAQLGGTLPNVGPQAGAATPYDYVDPPTDVATNTLPGMKIGQLNDGTQIWRLDHQGVDTHLIHFHLMNVQLINRVAIDGQLFPPDPNELGWKETVRVNPGVDTIIAMRPEAPTLPFKLPDSIRPLDPALPVGATFTDTLGTVQTNTMTNFGWEYVWHCHLLGHEENDMMRPFVFEVAPAAPSALGATPNAPGTARRITIRWTNNATYPAATDFFIQRSTNASFTSAVATFQVGPTSTLLADSSAATGTTYFYRVRAETAIAYSPWSNTANGTIVNTVRVNSASFSGPIAYNIASLLTQRLTANINQSSVNARVVITGGGVNWTIFNGAIANAGNANFTFPAWNGKNPANGAKVPFAGTYTFTLTVTKGTQTATFSGPITIGNVWAQLKGSALAGVTNNHVVYLVGSTATPYAVNVNPSVVTTRTGTFGIRVTGPAGYNRVPTNSPWAISPAFTALTTGRLAGTAAIRTTGNYTFSVTPSVAATYTVTVLE